MSAKRQNTDVPPSSSPELLDAINGLRYTIPFKGEFIVGRSPNSHLMVESAFISRFHCVIKYVNREFIIYDNNSFSGTYVNWNKLIGGKKTCVVLNHGDLITFGTEKAMKLILQFIFNPKLSDIDKRPKYDCFAVPDILPFIQKYENRVKEVHSRMLDFKVEHLVLKNNIRSQFIEFQNNLQESLKPIIDCLNTLKLKQQECSIETFKTKVNALLEDYFQCPICNDVIIKASVTHCNHIFCQKCLLQWLAKTKNCPVCRSSLQTTTYCQSIDNYITDLCELLGGAAKEQRDILRKEMLVSESTGNRGRKRRYTRRSVPQATRLSYINTRSRADTVDIVDLTSPI